MSREYIDREDVLEKGFFYMLPNGDTSPLVVFVSAIKAIPAADVRPVVRGRWVKKHDDVCYWHECSECGVRLPRNYWGFVWESLYCPNCGAKMGES